MHRSAKIKAVLFVAVYLFFIGMLDYPYISRIYNERVQGECITDYAQDVGNVDDAEIAMQEAKIYNDSLRSGTESIKDAFDSDGEHGSEYLSILSVNQDHTIGYLSVPAINLELPIYHGTSEDVLQKGVGHLEGSSMPVGGENTHTCLSAHRGLPNKRLFTNLDLLKEGDEFFINVLGETLAYRINDIRTVLPTEIEPLAIREGEDLATLITCTPYGINSHRLYVTGVRILYNQTVVKQDAVLPPENWLVLNWYIPVTGILLLMMLLILVSFFRSQREPEELSFKRFN